MADVLVVDDSPTVIRFVEKALRPDGHVVRSLDSFIQLGAIVRDGPPDLILLDLNIPALSGLSMGSIVRKYEKSSIPILIYSSQDDEEMRHAAASLDAVGFLRKSLAPDALRAAVKEALAGGARRSTVVRSRSGNI